VVAILAIAFAPDLGGTSLRRALQAIGLMAGSFAVVWITRWIGSRCERLWTRWIKGFHYDQVYEIAAQNRRELEASQGLIRRVLAELPSYTDLSVSVFAGRILLEFPKKGKRALPAVGRLLSLFDCEGGAELGTFEVTSSDGKLCHAEERGDLDAVFAGYTRSSNARFLPEHMALFTLEQDGPDE
jgi:hypothetical protein